MNKEERDQKPEPVLYPHITLPRVGPARDHDVRFTNNMMENYIRSLKWLSPPPISVPIAGEEDVRGYHVSFVLPPVAVRTPEWGGERHQITYTNNLVPAPSTPNVTAESTGVSNGNTNEVTSSDAGGQGLQRVQATYHRCL